jgi:hypothetical protein
VPGQDLVRTGPQRDLAIASAVRGRPDLEQLFRRVAFNVAIGNRERSLENHGFLLTQMGWRLAPAIGLNPHKDRVETSGAGAQERARGYRAHRYGVRRVGCLEAAQTPGNWWAV